MSVIELSLNLVPDPCCGLLAPSSCSTSYILVCQCEKLETLHSDVTRDEPVREAIDASKIQSFEDSRVSKLEHVIML